MRVESPKRKTAFERGLKRRLRSDLLEFVKNCNTAEAQLMLDLLGLWQTSGGGDADSFVLAQVGEGIFRGEYDPWLRCPDYLERKVQQYIKDLESSNDRLEPRGDGWYLWRRERTA